MISFQHACLPSVLAYAAATTLPPSPVETPARCESPFIDVLETEPLEQTLVSFAESSRDDGPTSCAIPMESARVDEPKPDDSTRTEPEINKPNLDHVQEGVGQAESVKQDSAEDQRPLMAQTPMISVAQLAHQTQLQRHQETQKYNTLLRIRDLHASIHVSTRLLRIATTTQKGLVETFKHGDKSGFASIYNTIHDIREVCDSTTRRNILDHDPLIGTAMSSMKTKLPSFASRLSPESKTDLLEILTLVRTDSNFLFQCISNLTPSQLSALVTTVHSLELSGSGVFSESRGRNQSSGRSQSSFFKRNNISHASFFKEHAFSFERTDPLSALVFNVYATASDPESSEANLRLDVWSSTCAKLVSHGGSGQYNFVGHILNIWSGLGEWKAKSKLENYLMDVLQNGAFLLEHTNTRNPGMESDYLDPMRTDVAEQFFRSSVKTLFEVLDDSDGGLPAEALEFGKVIVEKIDISETRRRFLGYIFYQWFFCKFLHNALSFPEAHGLLLDFHITKDARERLLGQISLHAQTQVYEILHSPPQFSYARPEIRTHVESMLSHLSHPPSMQHDPPSFNPSVESLSLDDNGSEPVLLLSATDITTVLNAIFPKTTPVLNSAELLPHQSVPSSPTATHFSKVGQSNQSFGSGLFQGRIDARSSRSSTAKTVFTTETSFQDATRSYFVRPNSSAAPIPPRDPLAHNADRIRYEISEIRESEDRPAMDHPASEDWAMFSICEGNNIAFHLSDDDVSTQQEPTFGDDPKEETFQHYDKVEDAILKLIFDSKSPHKYQSFTSASVNEDTDLKQKFIQAMGNCQRKSDFVGAHYWWEAARILRGAYSAYGAPNADAKFLAPMFVTAQESVEISSGIIQRCERSFVDLKKKMEQIQAQIKTVMGCLAGLRTKMWYMTDVKNSSRYEEAKNVALALKTMAAVQPPSPPPTESRYRPGSRSLGGSFLQKPEIQVMNVMRAPKNQGGPFKLADEQIDITRKWLQRYGIDNFCRGEERIHRFCYEVKASISKLVGETMYDTPVLWSSELYQRERSMYETSGTRPLTGSLRSNATSEDSLGQPTQPFGMRSLDQLFRPTNDVPSLVRKSSYQSFASDRWKSKDISSGDTSSIGESPGKAGSTSTADSIQPFWSPMHTHAQSTTSASSLRSRPPSMFSDVAASRRVDHNTQGKASFLDELRRTATSLLLSDLGCPVWSCGSETDAWFSEYLNQEQVQTQMENRARMDRFLSECSAGSADYLGDSLNTNPATGLRRTRSAPSLRFQGPESSGISHRLETLRVKAPEERDFAYDQAFQQLMDGFSRPSNPYAKLHALHDMWTLVVASLKSSDQTEAEMETGYNIPDLTNSSTGNHRRNSMSSNLKWDILREDQTPTPSSPGISQGFSLNSSPSEMQITDKLRGLIQKYQPKTLFRDLQFIAAFIPSEILSKTERTAFLQFGLAALDLKDDVCNSMIEIADQIVCQELTQRQRPPPLAYDSSSKMGHDIRDAANMWIITAREGNAVAQRELAILYLTHPHLLRPITLPLTKPGDTFKTDMMYRRDRDSKSDPQNMCLALHWMQLSAAGGDRLAQNRLREREEFDSIA